MVSVAISITDINIKCQNLNVINRRRPVSFFAKRSLFPGKQLDLLYLNKDVGCHKWIMMLTE